jgi:hypothetical protein
MFLVSVYGRMFQILTVDVAADFLPPSTLSAAVVTVDQEKRVKFPDFTAVTLHTITIQDVRGGIRRTKNCV